ncbi:MAG: HAD family hydrolase [Lutibacter sp.]|uniref:HAD family hydrolase n=1 Tax=Lutibacter sp. TaxID=1925666 RepID=UPI00299D3440|nr:HAD family hydrolase [Lutibacter sp.]MDX1828195.1 HAD family hydrolase [Lutibacter sp.]
MTNKVANGFKGVIFDLDGTLINSVEDIADAMNVMLKQNDLPTHNLKTYEQFLGSGIRDLLKKAVAKKSNEKEFMDTCWNEMIAIYTSNCTNKTKPYNGIINLLDTLVSQKIEMAILTNKADHLAKKIVAELFPTYNFEAVIGLTNEEAKKPNPVTAIQISKKFNLNPNEIVFVGDSGIDMQTATNAGMFAVGVAWGYRDKNELIANGAKFILNHPSDLFKIL